jgi:hypothetical protein
MHVGDPLFVLFPDFDHGSGGFLTLVIHSNGTVTESGNKDVAFDLV